MPLEMSNVPLKAIKKYFNCNSCEFKNKVILNPEYSYYVLADKKISEFYDSPLGTCVTYFCCNKFNNDSCKSSCYRLDKLLREFPDLRIIQIIEKSITIREISVQEEDLNEIF